MRLAVLDDYANLALRLANWAPIAERCAITIFDQTVGVGNDAIRRLAPFDIICHMRERTAMPADLIAGLPQSEIYRRLPGGNIVP